MDSSSVSLGTYPNSSAIAILFTSNSCPYDTYYADRIKNLVSVYQGKIQFLFINSYQEPGEAEEKMKEAFGRWGLAVPYLADKEQTAMISLGAKKSPEVFLLKNENGKHTVSYSGAIDDNPQAANAVVQSYLKAAIDKLLSGQNLDVPMVRAVGCTIRRK